MWQLGLQRHLFYRRKKARRQRENVEFTSPAIELSPEATQRHFCHIPFSEAFVKTYPATRRIKNRLQFWIKQEVLKEHVGLKILLWSFLENRFCQFFFFFFFLTTAAIILTKGGWLLLVAMTTYALVICPPP